MHVFWGVYTVTLYSMEGCEVAFQNLSEEGISLTIAAQGFFPSVAIGLDCAFSPCAENDQFGVPNSCVWPAPIVSGKMSFTF